jgi:aspartyl-tRNA(Asn)/glutamyl-tRNA(Gln) amidotransferase subunit C
MSGLSRGDVEHVANLARLGLTEGELTLLEGQLNHILEQYTKLAELDTDAIPPTAQTIELENILREDVVRPSLPIDDVLRNVSDAAGGYIVVPAVLGEDADRPAR